MNDRICSVIAALTLMTLSSGCSGVRNFLFGRGARCGSCINAPGVTPQFGNTLQAPCGDVPYAPTCSTPQCAGPTCQHVTAPSGCNDCCTGEVYAGMPCGGCGNYGIPGNCGCGSVAGGYGPAVVDPYLSGVDTYGGQIVDGQVMGGQVVGENVTGGQPYTVPIQPDDFTTRNKFDSDGNRILWEEPIPENATSL